MSPLERRSRNSFEGRTHSVGFLILLISLRVTSERPAVENRTEAHTKEMHRLGRYFVLFSSGYLVALMCIAFASLAGSLVGNLLPRLMLHERGVPVSSVKFAKTEANKPYINMVRYCQTPLGCGTASEELIIILPFFPHTYKTTQTTLCARRHVLIPSHTISRYQHVPSWTRCDT